MNGYKNLASYRIVVHAENIPPFGAIVQINGAQPKTSAAIDVLYHHEPYIVYPDEIEPVPDDDLNDFLDACERSRDMLASVRTEAEFNDLEHAIILIREAQESGEWERLTNDPAHQQRMATLATERGWGMGQLEERAWEMYGEGYAVGMKDAARLEEENRALQAANRRLQDKLAEEARLHRARAEKVEDALRKINDLISQGYAYRDIRSVIWSVIE